MGPWIEVTYQEIIDLRHADGRRLYYQCKGGFYQLYYKDAEGYSMTCSIDKTTQESVDFEANIQQFCNKPVDPNDNW